MSQINEAEPARTQGDSRSEKYNDPGLLPEWSWSETLLSRQCAWEPLRRLVQDHYVKIYLAF